MNRTIFLLLYVLYVHTYTYIYTYIHKYTREINDLNKLHQNNFCKRDSIYFKSNNSSGGSSFTSGIL